MNKQLLGGISYEAFFRDYWQKRPLLVRKAISDFTGLIEPDALFKLAGNEDVTARLVYQKNQLWNLERGPFKRKDFKTPHRGEIWTLLVQELNHYIPAAELLLQQFDFIPHARLDDLMVSYAPAGGGVGPHFDSYDVFLLQGRGHRRWQISAQSDLTLIDGLPLKILQNFVPEQEWILAPGDMLYLPPHFAHNGTAIDECMTYSIGFRAPATQEIATQFLVYLQDKIQLLGQYQDPDLTLQTHPAQMGEAMITQITAMVAQVQWGRAEVIDFIGRYLTEPKPHVYYQPPVKPMGKDAFEKRVHQQGLRLAPQSQMLFYADQYYLNGERVNFMACDVLRILADKRKISGQLVVEECWQWLYQGYLDGFFLVGMG
ncbi:MAG: cupin domain-containing protein [Sulfuriferula sp.]